MPGSWPGADAPSPAGEGVGRQEGPELLVLRDDVVVLERGVDEAQPVLPKKVLRDGALRNRGERDVPRAAGVHEFERLVPRAPLRRVDVDELAGVTVDPVGELLRLAVERVEQ